MSDDDIVFLKENVPHTPETHDVNLCYDIARSVMELSGAGFIILGSPNSMKTDSGMSYPTGVAVLVSDTTELSKFEIGNILRDIANELSRDIEDIEEIINE